MKTITVNETITMFKQIPWLMQLVHETELPLHLLAKGFTDEWNKSMAIVIFDDGPIKVSGQDSTLTDAKVVG